MKKKAFVLFVKIILTCRKWKVPILHLGTKTEKRLREIAKCYVKTIIEENPENKNDTKRMTINHCLIQQNKCIQID